MDKILSGVKSLASKISKSGSRSSMKVIYIYGGCLLLLIVLVTAAWIFNWYATGSPDIPQILNIIDKLTQWSVVTAVIAVCVFMVNKNRDGRPDAAEALAKNPTAIGTPNMPRPVALERKVTK